MHKILFAWIFFFAPILNSGHLLAQDETAYAREIEAWQQKRNEGLKAENGWLNLAGLFWLDEGENSFGSGPKNKIIFPTGTIPEEAGDFVLSGNKVIIRTKKRVSVIIAGKPVQEALIYNADSARQPVVAYENLRWTIIRREDKIGIRLRNLKSPALDAFEGVDRYAADASWKIEAILENQSLPKTVSITNVLGQTSQQLSPGKLVFSIGGKKYALDALEEDGQLFIIFGDETSGLTTYPSGRFLKAAHPGANGKTILDFNKSYNPPCAFTEFATCPLPPRQNILPVSITAGEKYDGLHSKK